MKVVGKADLKRLNEYTENTKWLLENMDKLRQKLPGRYVAVSERGNRILDAPTLDELLKLITMSGGEPEEWAIDYVSKEAYALIV